MANLPLPRTDLASEAHRLLRNGVRDLSPLPGIEAWEEQREGCALFHVRVLNGEGAAALGKPVGRYCTLEASEFPPRADPRFAALVSEISGLIRQLLPGEGPALVVGLGNVRITPDALGPLAAQKVLATRHLRRSGVPLFAECAEVAVCTPGVLAASGIESAAQVAALCRELRPARVLVMDALAGAEADRLCRTVQLTDSGIAPGSGVGNDRAPLSRETLGVPVLALGVPTVVDAALFGSEQYRGFFVTPRSIDESLSRCASLLAYAVNLALQPTLELEEIRGLVE